MNAATEVVIFGVSSTYTWDLVESCQRKELVITCVDNFGGGDTNLPGFKELQTSALSFDLPVISGLGSPKARYGSTLDAYKQGFRNFFVLIDPTTPIAKTAQIKHGTYINASSVIASNVKIACHVNVNRSASIGHDVILDSFSSIGPGAILTGSVHVGAGAFVGAGAILLPKVKIGKGAIIGAGAVVVKDVPPGQTVIGNPAQKLQKNHPEADNEVHFDCPLCQE
jgi:sugar O-acyltransferase (sialic acid O-acetyltransferase NeuD family)